MSGVRKEFAHFEVVGKFYIVAQNYISRFKIGGNQKLQKIIGEDLYTKKGKYWWWNNGEIIQMKTSKLKNLIKKIENA